MSEFTEILQRVSRGEERAADGLTPLLYTELRSYVARLLARGGPVTIEPTEIVHEAYLRLVDQDRATYRDRMHFFSVAALVTRRVLVDHLRKVGSAKRGSGVEDVSLDSRIFGSEERPLDALAVHEALSLLERDDAPSARLVELRFFGGLAISEAAEVMGISESAAHRRWRYAKAYLFRLLRPS